VETSPTGEVPPAEIEMVSDEPAASAANKADDQRSISQGLEAILRAGHSTAISGFFWQLLVTGSLADVQCPLWRYPFLPELKVIGRRKRGDRHIVSCLKTKKHKTFCLVPILFVKH
jgi:hypothetical protein